MRPGVLVEWDGGGGGTMELVSCKFERYTMSTHRMGFSTYHYPGRDSLNSGSVCYDCVCVCVRGGWDVVRKRHAHVFLMGNGSINFSPHFLMWSDQHSTEKACTVLLCWVCRCMRVACVCFWANSNKSGGLWITSSSDNYLSTSQFKVSFTNPFACQQIYFSQVYLNESAVSNISIYSVLFF